MPPAPKNQNPEQIARDHIDVKLAEAGWFVQSKDKINFNAGLGVAVREYQTDIGPADYDNLPEPDSLAEDIIENLEAGLASFRLVLKALRKAG